MVGLFFAYLYFFFFKQKTAYEMRISDWSSDVCSSDLHGQQDEAEHELPAVGPAADESLQQDEESGAGERPEEAPDAAEDDEDDDLAGTLPRQHRRADETVQLGKERAGEPRHHGREGRSEERSVGNDGVRRCK